MLLCDWIVFFLFLYQAVYILTLYSYQIFNTEEGVLSSELGVYRAETVTDKNVRGARGRFKMYGDDEVYLLSLRSLSCNELSLLAAYLHIIGTTVSTERRSYSYVKLAVLKTLRLMNGEPQLPL